MNDFDVVAVTAFAEEDAPRDNAAEVGGEPGAGSGAPPLGTAGGASHAGAQLRTGRPPGPLISINWCDERQGSQRGNLFWGERC
jgi:hypothetical protein